MSQEPLMVIRLIVTAETHEVWRHCLMLQNAEEWP